MNRIEIDEITRLVGFSNDGSFRPVHQMLPLFAAEVERRTIQKVLNCYSPDDTAADWTDKIRCLGVE